LAMVLRVLDNYLPVTHTQDRPRHKYGPAKFSTILPLTDSN
jgi:hypothetical protein